ncbi:hypothetical protein MTX20_21205 [Bradyrhizobium sp. ISRA435]|nr:hypothetical protein MTX20_21205 [Bradyrhizobium sp. ISRA435]
MVGKNFHAGASGTPRMAKAQFGGRCRDAECPHCGAAGHMMMVEQPDELLAALR